MYFLSPLLFQGISNFHATLVPDRILEGCGFCQTRDRLGKCIQRTLSKAVTSRALNTHTKKKKEFETVRYVWGLLQIITEPWIIAEESEGCWASSVDVPKELHYGCPFAGVDFHVSRTEQCSEVAKCMALIHLYICTLMHSQLSRHIFSCVYWLFLPKHIPFLPITFIGIVLFLVQTALCRIWGTNISRGRNFILKQNVLP